jgi:tRNA (cmo5U34)-methyltransferase
MSKLSHPSEHHQHDHQHDDQYHHHRHDHDSHDWHSSEYVSSWAAKQDPKERDREEQFRLLANTIPYDQQLPIRILDVGAGYGALTRFLLQHFPNATAVCQDGSQEMITLGRARMEDLNGRFNYIHCDFSKTGWSKLVPGLFDAVVSSIAIHNVHDPKIIRGIYQEIFPLVKTGGCFLNFDRMHPPLKDQMEWLREAGFRDVKCFWKGESRALFGGFK